MKAKDLLFQTLVSSISMPGSHQGECQMSHLAMCQARSQYQLFHSSNKSILNEANDRHALIGIVQEPMQHLQLQDELAKLFIWKCGTKSQERSYPDPGSRILGTNSIVLALVMMVFTPYLTHAVILGSPLLDTRVLNPTFYPPNIFLPDKSGDAKKQTNNKSGSDGSSDEDDAALFSRLYLSSDSDSGSNHSGSGRGSPMSQGSPSPPNPPPPPNPPSGTSSPTPGPMPNPGSNAQGASSSGINPQSGSSSGGSGRPTNKTSLDAVRHLVPNRLLNAGYELSQSQPDTKGDGSCFLYALQGIYHLSVLISVKDPP